uniref:TF-B3 domain-containing protein n=1 Tax=Solanum lycopersicum TaxID=4081 RepID=A0A3Q7ET12_SOLLC
MEKGFFRIFNPESSAKRMSDLNKLMFFHKISSQKIPSSYATYKNGKLPRNVFFRDRFNNMWPMGVTKIEGALYFENGWKKFIEDNNTLEYGDFMIFDYDGNETFDFKVLEMSGCVKEGAKCEKKKEVFLDLAGRRKAITCKVRNMIDRHGIDIFRSGSATKPKNPYFVAKIIAKRRNQQYVPIDVVRDYKLELPPSMIIRDSAGREFETKVKYWKDGRIWLVGGWRSICRWNLVEKNDRFICEFVREQCGKISFLQVRVLQEGSNSHPNNK